MVKDKGRRVIFATTFEKDKNIPFEKVWDKIIKETIEKKHGKIK